MALQTRGLILFVWIGLLLSATPSFAQQNSDPHLSDALNKLDRYVNQTMGKTKVPGVSVAVVYTSAGWKSKNSRGGSFCAFRLLALTTS